MSDFDFPEDKIVGTEGLNSHWSGVRTAVFAKLMSERSDIDMVTHMLLERLSYLYARIRQKEAMGSFGNERNYKAAMVLLSQFMAEVRKADNRSEMVDLMKADVVDIVVRGVKESMHDLPADQQKAIMSNVIQLVNTPVAV